MSTVLISFGEKVYRPAGYRIPQVGETYIAKTGKLATRKALDNPCPSERLIVREYDAERDF